MDVRDIDAFDKYQKLNINEFWQITKWAFIFIYKLQPRAFIVYVISSSIQNLRGIGNWFIFAKILDQALEVIQNPNPNVSDIYPYLAAILIYNTAFSIIAFFSNYSGSYIRNYAPPQITQALYKQLNRLGIQSLEQPIVNNKIHRANEYINNINPYTRNTVSLIAEVVRIATSFVVIATFLPILLPVIVASAIPYIIWDKHHRTLLYKFVFDHTEDSRKTGMTSYDLRNATKLQEIFIAGSFKFLDSKFIVFKLWFAKQVTKIIKRWSIGSHGLRLASDIVLFFGYIRVFTNFIRGLTTIGNVTFYLNTLNQFQDALMLTARKLNDLSESALQIREVYQLFNMDPSFPEGKNSIKYLSKGPTIEFKRLSFSYPNTDKPVIKNISLVINSGEKIAIVGHNGAGKTTLVKLVSKIYLPTSGQILVNNKDLSLLKTPDWYKNMGVLFQDFNTYPQLTVKENIYMGNPSEPIDEVSLRLAAQAADATDFINEYPNGFDQILSEKIKGGIRPSFGQWQKLAIARFFYRNAPLIIFDEPTASIDAVSEYNIFNNIYEFFKDKTVIIISHRFSTVRNADRILVMENGEIVEEGSHNELMSKNGKYAKAFMLQAKGYVTEIAHKETV
jgi:ATP-binding cassette, subfamily B, bacterial